MSDKSGNYGKFHPNRMSDKDFKQFLSENLPKSFQSGIRPSYAPPSLPTAPPAFAPPVQEIIAIPAHMRRERPTATPLSSETRPRVSTFERRTESGGRIADLGLVPEGEDSEAKRVRQRGRKALKKQGVEISDSMASGVDLRYQGSEEIKHKYGGRKKEERTEQENEAIKQRREMRKKEKKERKRGVFRYITTDESSPLATPEGLEWGRRLGIQMQPTPLPPTSFTPGYGGVMRDIASYSPAQALFRAGIIPLSSVIARQTSAVSAASLPAPRQRTKITGKGAFAKALKAYSAETGRNITVRNVTKEQSEEIRRLYM
jgi:hypothetical protein